MNNNIFEVTFQDIEMLNADELTNLLNKLIKHEAKLN